MLKNREVLIPETYWPLRPHLSEIGLFCRLFSKMPNVKYIWIKADELVNRQVKV